MHASRNQSTPSVTTWRASREVHITDEVMIHNTPDHAKLESSKLSHTEKPTSVLDAALMYAQRGYRVLRVYGVDRHGKCLCRRRSNCPKPGKHPVGTEWQHKATTDIKTIKTWFADPEKYNIGLLTGKESGIIVVDVDPRHGGEESFRELLKQGSISKNTPVQKTGGNGYHVVLQPPGDCRYKSESSVMPGIDIRADGNGMIVVWPSRHHTGGQYRWVEKRSLFDLSPPPFPNEWKHLIHKSSDKSRPAPELGSSVTPEAPTYGGQGVDTETQDTQDTHDTHDTQETQETHCSGRQGQRADDSAPEPLHQVPSMECWERIIERTLPERWGQRHERLWAVTRELVAIHGPDPMPHRKEIEQFVGQWYRTALERKVSMGMHSLDECVARVLDSWEDVRLPAGTGPVTDAFRKAKDIAPHPACERLLFGSRLRGILVGACAQLASQSTSTSPRQFFLSCRTAATALQQVGVLGDDGEPYSYQEVNKAINACVKRGILRLITKGSMKDGASVYEFIA
jgi:hypothetical protein